MKWKALSIMLFLLLGLAACSSVSASGGTDHPTTLYVTRTEGLPGYDFAPLDMTVSDVTTVQNLYQAAYALPHPASGTYNCPADIGLTYHLEFFEGDTSVQQMDFNATGCEVLQITQDDIRMTNSAFRELLRKALGIPSLVPPIPGQNQP